MDKVQVTVLRAFASGDREYLPGPAAVPADAVEKLVERGVIAPVEGVAQPQAQGGGEVETLTAERDALQTQLEQQAKQFDASYAEVVKENEALKKGFVLEPHQVELIGALHTVGADVINELLRAGLDSKNKVLTATAKDLEALPKIGKVKAAAVRELLKG